jgi:aminoglycoside/choline kinase family phosphotransferase
MTEMRLLTEWMLPSLNIQPTEQQLETIEQAFDFLAIEATNQPQVIVHRDFHSRNLMKIENEQELGVIDFKMR